MPSQLNMGFAKKLSSILPFIVSTQAYVMPDGHTGKLPTLGWNTWYAYYCDINEQQVLAAANDLASTGLQAAGYHYVDIDDCWSEKSGRVDGHIAVNRTSFPDGMDGLANKIHDMDLKFGIYSSAGTETCAGYPASLEYEDIDAADFASWGVDLLKYDNCGVPSNWTDEYVFCNEDSVKVGPNGTCTLALEPRLAPDNYDWSKSKSAERYNRMRDALAKQDREIIFNMCIWGTADVTSWGNKTGIDWRMSGDSGVSWASITHITNMNSFKLNAVNFWSHNDMDYLQIGNAPLTLAESRSHFALWAAMKSPLIISTTISKLNNDQLNILKNKYLLAFNQDDEYGQPATPYKWGVNPDWTYNSTNPAEYWVGPSKQGHLVLMFNSLNTSVTKTAKWSEIPGLSCKRHIVTDVWSGKFLGCKRSYSTKVGAHDTAAILVGREC